jgi:hypothetical protein
VVSARHRRSNTLIRLIMSPNPIVPLGVTAPRPLDIDVLYPDTDLSLIDGHALDLWVYMGVYLDAKRSLC